MSTSNHDIYINIETNNKAQKEIDGLKESLKGAQRETDNFTEGIGGAQGKSQTFGQTAQGVFNKVGSGFKTAGGALTSYSKAHRAMSMVAVGGFMDMAKTSSEYGTTLVGITKMSDDSKLAGLGQADAVEVVKQSVDELASSFTNLSKQEIANQFLDISRAGYDLSDAMLISEAGMKLATASGEGLEDVTGILIRSMGAFGLGAGDAGEMARVLASSANASTSDVSDMIPALNMVGATAHASGISFEETANSIAFMHSKGVQASTGARGLRTMLINMADASNEGTDALGKLGFEMDENGLKYDNLGDLVSKYQSATANLSDEQKRNLAVQLGGKEAMSSILSLMSEADVAYDEHGNKIEGVSSDYASFAEEVDSFTNDDLEDLKQSMQDADPWTSFMAQVDNAKIELANALAPTIGDVLEKLTEFLVKLQDPEFASHVAKIIEMGAKYLIFAQVVGVVGSVLTVIGGVFSAIGTIIGIVTTVVSAVSAVFGFLAPVIAFLASPIGIVIGVLALLIGAFTSTWDTTKSFGDNMKAVWEKIVGWVTNPIESINDALQWFADKMTWLTEPVGKAWEKIKGFFSFGSKSAKKDTEDMSKDVEKNTLDASKNAEKNSEKINKGVEKGTKDASKSADKNTAQITTDVSKNLSEASNESMKQGQEIAKGLNKGMEDASKGVSKSLNEITKNINKGTADWDKSFSKGMGNMSKTTNKVGSEITNNMTRMMINTIQVVTQGAMNSANSFRMGMSTMIGYAQNISSSVANTLYSWLGSINLYTTGANIMVSFANGMYSQMGAVASASAYASSLARTTSTTYDDYTGAYGDTSETVMLSTDGNINLGSVSNPMGMSNRSFAIPTPKVNEANSGTPEINLTIYETVDGEGITRVVNEHNNRSKVRIKTVRG